MYLTIHHKWTDEFDTINRDLVHAKYDKIPFQKKLYVTKWVNKLLPLNQRRYKRKLFPTPYCPSWCQCIETEEHLITCNHHTRQAHTKAFKATMKRTMINHKIDPYLKEIINHYMSKLENSTTGTGSIYYQKIHNRQLALGPYSIFTVYSPQTG